MYVFKVGRSHFVVYVSQKSHWGFSFFARSFNLKECDTPYIAPMYSDDDRRDVRRSRCPGGQWRGVAVHRNGQNVDDPARAKACQGSGNDQDTVCALGEDGRLFVCVQPVSTARRACHR